MVHSLRKRDKTGGVIFHIDSAMTLACCPFAAKERCSFKRGERRSTELHDNAKRGYAQVASHDWLVAPSPHVGLCSRVWQHERVLLPTMTATLA
jgi:hypothetical protein